MKRALRDEVRCPPSYIVDKYRITEEQIRFKETREPGNPKEAVARTMASAQHGGFGEIAFVCCIEDGGPDRAGGSGCKRPGKCKCRRSR
jgi:hypothetical protein